MNFNDNTTHLYKRGVDTHYLAFIFLLCLVLIFSYKLTYSATVDELQEQIQIITENKIKLESEIANYEKQLKDIGEQADSLKNAIKTIDTTISKNSLDIKLTENKISSTELEISKLSIKIKSNVKTIDKNLNAIAQLIKKLNIYGNYSIFENFLIYKNLSDLWNEEKDIYLIQSEIQNKINETRNTKVVLETNKKSAENKKKDLLILKTSLMDKKKVLDITKKEKSKLLTETKNSEANYKKILDEKKVLADAFNNELELFESKLQFVIDANSIPGSKNGILYWPLNIIKITQKFGYTQFGKNVYVNGFHNGVDFRASIGTEVKASLGGVVKGIGDTDSVCPSASYGKWVFVEHGNGLSTIYGHLSLIKVVEGQTISSGDVIGYSGNTGFSTGPHLHMSVYATQGVRIMSRKSTVCKGTYTLPIADTKAYLDPLLYLPSY